MISGTETRRARRPIHFEQSAEEKQLGDQGEALDPEIDIGEETRALIAGRKYFGDEGLLFQI